MSFDDAISDDESGDGDGGKTADPEQDFNGTHAMLRSRSGTSRSRGDDDGAADLGVVSRRDSGCSRPRLLNWGGCGNDGAEHTALCLDPICIRRRVLLAGLVPCLGLEELDAHRALPEGVVHDRVSGHAGHTLEYERNVAFDLVVTGPDSDRVSKALIAIVLRGPPQVELCADALNIGGENGDVVALPLAVVEGDGLGLCPPFASKGTAPHGAGVFVPD
jgi:hypothetical protein